MQTYKTLADVVALAEFAHRNQTDKAGLPYIDHPRRVMEAVQRQGAMPYVQMAAILHDVTEDTAFTCDMLLTLGVPEAAVHLVRLLDRDASERLYTSSRKMPYASEIGEKVMTMTKDEFYYHNIRNNSEARLVKLADINDNTQEWRLSYLPDEKQKYLRNKYHAAKLALGVNLQGWEFTE